MGWNTLSCAPVVEPATRGHLQSMLLSAAQTDRFGSRLEPTWSCQHDGMDFTMVPVAMVREGRTGVQDDFWGGTTCRIELDPAYNADSLAGLSDFSHLEVVYVFDRVDATSVETTAATHGAAKTGRLSGSSGNAASADRTGWRSAAAAFCRCRTAR